jgi:hypothetical protein
MTSGRGKSKIKKPQVIHYEKVPKRIDGSSWRVSELSPIEVIK